MSKKPNGYQRFEPMKKNIAVFISERRHSRGLTQTELGAMAGVSKGLINNIDVIGAKGVSRSHKNGASFDSLFIVLESLGYEVQLKVVKKK